MNVKGKLKKAVAVIVAMAVSLGATGVWGITGAEPALASTVKTQSTADYTVEYVSDVSSADSDRVSTILNAQNTLTYSESSGQDNVVSLSVKKGWLLIEFGYDSFDGSNLRLSLYKDAACATTPVATVTGTEGAAYLQTNIAAAGTYYMRIDSPTKSTDTFSCVYSGVSFPVLPSTATLKANRTNYYYSAKSMKTVYYKFKLSADTYVYTEALYGKIGSGKTTGTKYSLCNAKKKAIATSDRTKMGYYCLKKGTYYLKVSNPKYLQLVYLQTMPVSVSKGGTSKSKAVSIGNKANKNLLLELNGKSSGAVWAKYTLGKESKDVLDIMNESVDKKIKYKIYYKNSCVKSGSLKAEQGIRFTLYPSKATRGTYYIKIYKDSKSTNAFVTVKRTVTK